MSGNIFICYRRGDDPGFAQALFGRLEQAFAPDQLFMDVDSIPPGLDFHAVIESQVARCDVMLVVIGRGWLAATDESGHRRLDDINDFVRIEIEAAFAQDKRVIPVLVHEAKTPRPEELPESIRKLARQDPIRLATERFKSDTQSLIKTLQYAVDEADIVREQAEAVRRAEIADEQARQDEEARTQAIAELEAQQRAQHEQERARRAARAALTPEQIAGAQELANWNSIKDSMLQEDFRDHLARFPHGICEIRARQRLEALVWTDLGKAPSRAQLEGYLAEFPAGKHAEFATRELGFVTRSEEDERRRAARRAEAPPPRHKADYVLGVLALIGIFTILLTIAVPIYVFAGYYDVASSVDQPAILRWALPPIRRASIAHHADSVGPPPMTFSDQETVQAGARAFAERGCVVCHGAPGVPWQPFSEGLSPEPPELKPIVDGRTPRELFWVIKHGIAKTGMPSFGGEQGASDQEIWSIVAFLKKLPEVSVAQFKTWTAPESGPPSQ
jgi:mono/diheme cytochrome c family protein